MPTGHPLLDAELPGGGWPTGGLVELLVPEPASGEWPLLAGGLAAVAPDRPVLCVAPPYLLHAPALAAAGWALQRLLVVRPGSFADAVWSVEQGLRSGACAAVVWWQAAAGASAPGLATALRRLHWAAREPGCPLFAVRALGCQAQSSPALLRLVLTPAADRRLGVTVFKRRGAPMEAPLWLDPAPRKLRTGLRRTAPAPSGPAALAVPPSGVLRPLSTPSPLEPPDAVAGVAPRCVAA